MIFFSCVASQFQSRCKFGFWGVQGDVYSPWLVYLFLDGTTHESLVLGIYDAQLTSGKWSGYKYPLQNLKRLLVIHHAMHLLCYKQDNKTWYVLHKSAYKNLPKIEELLNTNSITLYSIYLLHTVYCLKKTGVQMFHNVFNTYQKERKSRYSYYISNWY